jgi:mannose-1-phosphate guanylyltransferase
MNLILVNIIMIKNLFVETIYPKVEKISIDNGILEKAKNVYVIPADLGWSDLGT